MIKSFSHTTQKVLLLSIGIMLGYAYNYFEPAISSERLVRKFVVAKQQPQIVLYTKKIMSLRQNDYTTRSLIDESLMQQSGSLGIEHWRALLGAAIDSGDELLMEILLGSLPKSSEFYYKAILTLEPGIFKSSLSMKRKVLLWLNYQAFTNTTNDYNKTVNEIDAIIKREIFLNLKNDQSKNQNGTGVASPVP